MLMAQNLVDPCDVYDKNPTETVTLQARKDNDCRSI